MKLKYDKGHKIKDIIFDFGGVLLDIDVPKTVEAFQRLGLSGLSMSDIHPHNSGAFLALELGEISTEEFWAYLVSHSAEGTTEADVLEAWNALLCEYDMRRFELLDKLKAQGYGLYLLSNTNLPHRQFFMDKFQTLQGRGLESYFDQCFYSDQMHLRKPDVRIYSQTLEQSGLDPHTTIFIDDNLHNLAGAHQVGLHTIHLQQPTTVLDLFE